MNSDNLSNDPNEITLYPSKLKQLGLLLITTFFTSAGIWLGLMGQWMGYVCAAFFVLGIPIFSIQLFPASSFLRLDQHGFEYASAFRKHYTRWNDVEDFGIMTLKQGYKMVGWNYKPEHVGGGVLQRMNRQFVGIEAGLPDTYGMKAEELLSLLVKYHETVGGKNAELNELPDTD